MAIGASVFAIIIVLGPATGAAINPARYLGAMTMQSAFGGTVSWSQAPAYIIGELAGGLLGALAYMGLSSTRRQAALTSLAVHLPADDASPVAPVVSTLSSIQAALGAAAAVAGLIGRSRSGCVQPAVVTGLHAGAALMGTAFTEINDEPAFAPSRAIVPAPNWRTYACADGKRIFLAALTPDLFFRALEAIGRLDIMALPEVAGDFQSILDLRRGRPAVTAALEPVLAGRASAEWLAVFREFRVPSALVQTRAEWIDGPVVADNGARITLPYPSVGATETVLLSAVLAEGKTVLRNAATEPEVVELALFLQRMGAQIELSPDRRIVIEGVPKLKAASTRLAGDRLEAFSYLVAGLITGGEVRVHGCPQDRLVTAITTLARMGTRFDITDEWITASAPDGLQPAAVHTDTHPGFMTDWQQPLMVLFTQANGMSVLHETVFENRLVYVPALQKMGCEIEVFAACLGGAACRFHDGNSMHSAVIRGVSKLQGAEVELPDVRAGFSAVLAASVADGPSVLHGVHHIERGYHRPFDQFTSLGLQVSRVDG